LCLCRRGFVAAPEGASSQLAADGAAVDSEDEAIAKTQEDRYRSYVHELNEERRVIEDLDHAWGGEVCEEGNVLTRDDSGERLQRARDKETRVRKLLTQLDWMSSQ
jgi:hypothetical protein